MSGAPQPISGATPTVDVTEQNRESEYLRDMLRRQQQQHTQVEQQPAATEREAETRPSSVVRTDGDIGSNTVKVRGCDVPLRDVTDAMVEQMSDAEYQDYHEKLRRAGLIDDDAFVS